jgi:hypothetical protein
LSENDSDILSAARPSRHVPAGTELTAAKADPKKHLLDDTITYVARNGVGDGVLPPIWQTVTLLNPVVYLISGFRSSFFEVADVSAG